MRRGIVLGMFVVLALYSPVLAETAVTVHVNGQQVQTDVAPVIVSNRTLVPLRAVSEALEADVFWNAQIRTVTILSGDRWIDLVPGQPTAQVNGEAVGLDVPARIEGGRTMVPLRFVAEALGVQVGWDGATRQVLITDARPDRPHDPAVIDRFEAANEAFAALTNFHADVLHVTEGAGPAAVVVEAIGTFDMVDPDTNGLSITFRGTSPGGVKVEVPMEFRLVGGVEYARVGTDLWTRSSGSDGNAQNIQPRQELTADLIRSLARRFFATPLEGGVTALTAVLRPAAGTYFNGSPGTQTGHVALTFFVDGSGRVAGYSELYSVMDQDGLLNLQRTDFINIQQGAAQPVRAPDESEIEPEPPAPSLQL